MNYAFHKMLNRILPGCAAFRSPEVKSMSKSDGGFFYKGGLKSASVGKQIFFKFFLECADPEMFFALFKKNREST